MHLAPDPITIARQFASANFNFGQGFAYQVERGRGETDVITISSADNGDNLKLTRRVRYRKHWQRIAGTWPGDEVLFVLCLFAAPTADPPNANV